MQTCEIGSSKKLPYSQVASFFSVMALLNVLQLEIKSFYSKTGSSEHVKCPHKEYDANAAQPYPSGNITDQICLLWKRLENQEM